MNMLPHPHVGPKPSQMRKGFCTQNTGSTLQRCPECKWGVWNLHQPFLNNTLMVCGWCFDVVEKRGDTNNPLSNMLEAAKVNPLSNVLKATKVNTL